MIRQAVFLVGGKGERLGQLTQDCPKPLLPLDEHKRFLDVLLFEAARSGFTDIVLLAGYLGDQFEQHYSHTQILDSRVRVVREVSAQGTGGALRNAAAHLDEQFLLSNGDSFFDFNLRAFARHLSPDCDARLALRLVEDPRRYGTVVLNEGKIEHFREKDENSIGPQLVNGGVYVISKAMLQNFKTTCSIEQDVFPGLANRRRLEGEVFEGYFLDIGLPETFATAKTEVLQQINRPIAFLDRDGVLNCDAGYTHRPEDLVWQPDAREAVRLLNDAGYYVIVVTNQAGVARGYYSTEAVSAFHTQMQKELAEIGGHFDALYFCPYHPHATVAKYRAADHPDRKPNPGMMLRAFDEWPHDRQRSFLIGDRSIDIQAAKNTGILGYLYKGGSLLEQVIKCMAISKRSPG